ncbi:SCO2521 family protein [Nocardia sp. NPDC051052]|uniref:SCO2521 family protein n=1 Tax=Nocardia sp. NPDC051052 TaxID=3364322 RepID=UPI0037B84712
MTDVLADSDEPPLVVLGEIHTCLLPSQHVLDTAASIELLSAVQQGLTVTSRERPMPLVISPNRFEGVDCDLIPASGKHIHVIGTIASRTVVIGGRVLQGSSQTRVMRSQDRQPWSYYLSRPGTVDAVSHLGTGPAGRLVDGHLRSQGDDKLDLTSISQRMSTFARVDPRLDQKMPFRAGTTRLRWAVEVDAGSNELPRFAFHLAGNTLRTVRLTLGGQDIAAAQRFCEDLAIHDWLLTTIGQVADRAGRNDHETDTVLDQLVPLLDQLVPLWMPGAHTAPQLRPLWVDLESDPGFTRQWTARVGQLRDRMTTATLTALRHSKIISHDW